TAQGTIQALNQSIKASDQGANTTESLHGMLETDAPIQEGDSGGPLVNGSGQVVGMDTAAQTTEDGQETTATQGYAIPINQAIAIADQINARKASTSVHIGLAGFIGVSETADCGTVTTGALICEVVPGSAASTAGLVSGDVITSVNGQKISSFNGLTNIMAVTHPGTKLSVVYVDRNGASHRTT